MNKCLICGMELSTKGNLTVHMRIHTGEKPFKCDTCEKSFRTKDELTVHKRIHTGEKPFKCDTCKKAFSQQSALTLHKRIHNGEKPFKCDWCEKAYIQQNHLTDHTGERPYSCDTCEKAFPRQDALTRHKRSHTGEKPYSCDACEKSFYTNGELKNHKWMSHTDLKRSYCELCQKSYYSSSDLPKHKESSGHLNKLESAKKTVTPSASTSFVDCGEVDIKLEIKAEETLDEDPLSINIYLSTFVACSEFQNKKSFSCDVCFKIFKSKEVLSIHKYLHPEPKIKPEIKEEETLDEDPLSINMEAENVGETLKQEIEGEEIEDKDSTDIIVHKIEI